MLNISTEIVPWVYDNAAVSNNCWWAILYFTTWQRETWPMWKCHYIWRSLRFSFHYFLFVRLVPVINACGEYVYISQITSCLLIPYFHYESVYPCDINSLAVYSFLIFLLFISISLFAVSVFIAFVLCFVCTPPTLNFGGIWETGDILEVTSIWTNDRKVCILNFNCWNSSANLGFFFVFVFLFVCLFVSFLWSEG